MKRRMELVRLILLDLEGETLVEDLTLYSREERNYHTMLLIEAGLVHGIILTQDDESEVARAIRLTWDGHEFLDASRDPSIWKRALEVTRAGVPGVPFAVLKSVLMRLIDKGLDL